MWTALGSAALNAYGASQSASAAGDAAYTQGQAASAAAARSANNLSDIKGLINPYSQSGGAANARLSYMLGNDPNAEARQGLLQSLRSRFPDLSPNWTPNESDVSAYGAANPSTDEFGGLTRSFTTADLNADPVYQAATGFGLQEGTRGIANAALAGGAYDSGATLKALARFATNYGGTQAAGAQSRFTGQQQQTYGMLSGQQNMGLQAANTLANAGTSSINSQNEYGTQAANASAAGSIGQANAYSGLGSSLGNAYSNYNNSTTLKQILANQNGAGGFGGSLGNSSGGGGGSNWINGYDLQQ